MPPVAQAGKFDFMDLGGSLNQGQQPNRIAPNEWQELINLYQFGTRLVRRGGMEKVTTVAAGENITSLFVLNDAAGLRDLMAFSATRAYRQDSTSLVEIPRLEGGYFNSTDLPWSLLQYVNTGYAMRRDNMSLRRFARDYVQQAGILAPNTAPVIADGGAGVMASGEYRVVYTGYNTVTGMESNPSPVSNALAQAVDKKIAVSGIAVHSNPQVNARRVYVTLPDQQGRYFFAFQINDNSTTTGEINLEVQDYGRAASFSNGTPPAALEAGDIWKERLFATDGVDLFFSEIGMMEAFDPLSIIPVFREDGHRLLGIHGFGDRLMLGKTNKMHYLLSTEGSFSLHTLSDKHGCWSHHSLKSAEGNLFWYGGDNVYRSDGANVYSISTIKIKDLLEAIPASRREYVIGAIWPKLSWYMLSIPQTSEDESGVEVEETVQRVSNPGFESGDLSGWTVTGPCSAVTSPAPPAGTYWCQLDGTSENPSRMSQVLDDVEADEEATVAVYLRAASGGTIRAFAYTDNGFYLQSDGTWNSGNTDPWATSTSTSAVLLSVETDPLPSGAITVTLEITHTFGFGAMYFDEYTWTVSAAPPDTLVDPNRKVLIYNYKTDAWAELRYITSDSQSGLDGYGPAFILSDFDENDEPALYASFYDQLVWQLESGLKDGDETFACQLVGPDHDFGAPGMAKFLQRISWLLGTTHANPNAGFNLGVYRDGVAGGLLKARTLNLNSGSPWHRASLSTAGLKPAYTLTPFLNYFGDTHLVIDGYSMEVLVQPGRLKRPL